MRVASEALGTARRCMPEPFEVRLLGAEEGSDCDSPAPQDQAFALEVSQKLNRFLEEVFGGKVPAGKTALSRDLRLADAAGWGPAMLDCLALSTRACLVEEIKIIKSRADQSSSPPPREQAPGVPLDEYSNRLIDATLQVWSDFCEATHTAEQVCGMALGALVPAEETTESLPRRRGLQMLFDKLLSDVVSAELGEAVLFRIAGAAARAVEGFRRRKMEIPDSRLRPLVQFFLHTGAYPLLEGIVLRSAKDFYRNDERFSYSEDAADECLLASVVRYLKYMEKSVSREKALVAASLHVSTLKPLLNTVRSELLADLDLLMQTRVLLLLLEAEAGHELRVLGAVVRESSPARRRTFRENILTAVKEQGHQLLSDVFPLHASLRATSSAAPPVSRQRRQRPSVSEDSLVEALLQMRAFHEKTLKDEFAGDAQVLLGLKEAWESFLSAEAIAVPVIAKSLARHVDALLRRVDPSSAAWSDEFDEVIRLFALTSDKEMFEFCYRCDLTRRLRESKSGETPSVERSFLQRLSDECGAQYTSKADGVLSDLESSRELSRQFRESPRGKTAKVDFEVVVSTLASWPAGPRPPRLPPPPAPLASVREAFAAFYADSFSGRRLEWMPHLGRCELQASLRALSQTPADGPFREYTLRVSEVQAIVLLLFNSQEEVSLNQAIEATGYSEAQLLSQMRGLWASPENALLKRRICDGSEVFSVDLAFTGRDVCLEIEQPSREAQESKSSSRLSASASSTPPTDSSHRVDAAVVRAVKSEGPLKGEALSEVVSQALGGSVDEGLLKKRIESLLEREYIRLADKESAALPFFQQSYAYVV